MNSEYNNNADEINLLDYWRVINRHRKKIGLFVFFATFLTVVISLIMPKYYKAEALIMPIGGGKGGGLSSLVSQFGGLAALAGIGASSNAPTLQLMAILKSRTLAEEMINKFDLIKVFNEKGLDTKDEFKMQQAMENTIKSLSGYVIFINDKKGDTIKITAEFKDPDLSAKVANGYVEGLQKFINENNLTVAKRNRIFVGKQLVENKRDLLEAGKELNEFYKTGKVSSVESKIDVSLIDDKFVEREIVDINDPDGKYLAAKLDDLQSKKKEIDNKMNQISKSDVIKAVPQQIYLQYLTFKRQMLTQINSLLTQQYEMAKIDEAKEDLAFQIIDKAKVPVQRSRPRRTQIVMMAFMASLFCAIFLVFFLEYVERMRQMTKNSCSGG
ncbi:MAG: Wzz/FepE/Etk N-terminal domain-containing protein [Pseudomonadota bacterium]